MGLVRETLTITISPSLDCLKNVPFCLMPAALVPDWILHSNIPIRKWQQEWASLKAIFHVCAPWGCQCERVWIRVEKTGGQYIKINITKNK